MSNKLAFILSGLLFFTICNSQESITSGTIRWMQNDQVHHISIGELAIAQSFDRPGIVLTQGYLQPIWKIMSTTQKNYFDDISITPYPNPFTAFLTLEVVLNNRIKNIEISITDIIGHSVYHKKLPLNIAFVPYSIDLRNLTQGVYTLTTLINNIPHSSKLIQKY